MIDRRRLGLSLAGLGASCLMPAPSAMAAEPPPEVSRMRLHKTTAICFAPNYIVESFLQAEGFEGVDYIPSAGGFSVVEQVARGDIDVAISFGGTVAHHVDAGLPILAIGGLHIGCYELFAHDPVRSIRDLKGRRVGIQTFASSAHLYLSIMAAHIGLDPNRDIEWVTEEEGGHPLERFVTGDTDAYLGFAPEPQELRDRGVGRVILNTMLDHPWSQYFCCLMYANADWVRRNPVATKRYLRALYRAAEFCTADPDAVARRMVERGFTANLDYAVSTVREIPYDLWRDYDAEDALRFYALRLFDAGLLQGNPNDLLARGADWRFLDELKREMKG